MKSSLEAPTDNAAVLCLVCLDEANTGYWQGDWCYEPHGVASEAAVEVVSVCGCDFWRAAMSLWLNTVLG